MDNPYPIKTVFTIPEAAAAIQAIAYPVKADWVRMKPIADELKLAIQSGELKADTPIITPSRSIRRLDGTHFEPHPDWMGSTIARADLLTWCEQRGIRPALLFPEQEPTEKTTYADDPANYHTPALDALRAAITHFWLNHDPKRPPKSPEIVEWLIQQHGLTKTMAESIDRVIRPDEYRKGGNTSSN